MATNCIKQFEALNLPKPLADNLTGALGAISVVGHQLGFSPTEEILLMSLILDFVAEVRTK